MLHNEKFCIMNNYKTMKLFSNKNIEKCMLSQKYVSQYVSEIANFSQHLSEAM